VIGFDPVVAVLLGVMPGARGQLIEDLRVDRCLVGDDLNWGHPGGVQRPGEETASFIDEPAISRDMSAGMGCVDEREPLHPTVDRDVIDIDAPLGQQFFNVAVDIPGA
jgi:hypothetical protein